MNRMRVPASPCQVHVHGVPMYGFSLSSAAAAISRALSRETEPRSAFTTAKCRSRLLAHHLDRDVARRLRAARQPHLREVIDVPEMLAFLVGERVEVLRAGHDLDPA